MFDYMIISLVNSDSSVLSFGSDNTHIYKVASNMRLRYALWDTNIVVPWLRELVLVYRTWVQFLAPTW